jgi:hypothetical protein
MRTGSCRLWGRKLGDATETTWALASYSERRTFKVDFGSVEVRVA